MFSAALKYNIMFLSYEFSTRAVKYLKIIITQRITFKACLIFSNIRESVTKSLILNVC